MDIIFMGTPEFAVPSLEALISAGYNVSLVVTQKDRRRNRGKKLLATPVKEKALEYKLPVYQPDDINSMEAIEKIKEINPACIVVVAYGQILKESLLSLAKYGCINVHASLLPKYRGAAPINWALIEGEKKTGITIMEMERGLDSGDILKTEEILIEDKDDSISLHDKLSLLGGNLLVDSLNSIEVLLKNKTPQDHSKSTYAKMLDRDLGKINWNDTGKNIINLVRGLKPWPGTYTIYKDNILKIHRLEKESKVDDYPPGYIIKANNKGIFVNCIDSCIIIKEMQFPNKKIINVKDYLVGNDFETGVFFK